MATKKIDITSTVVEKGVDIARDFVDKLIMPSIEEAGLLIKDQVTLWKFKNQIKILNQAKLYCEKHKIQLKTISLKVLCPLLEYSSLEEDDFLQNKWATLLSNMVDSTKNIENHVFPYILSQISKVEFELLDSVYGNKIIRLLELNTKIAVHLKDNVQQTLTIQISAIDEKIKLFNLTDKTKITTNIWDLRQNKYEIEKELLAIKNTESSYINQINQPEIVPADILKEFELSNLNRLGVIKEIHETYANSQTLEIPNDRNQQYLTFDLDIEVESRKNYVLTELGELFILACRENKQI